MNFKSLTWDLQINPTSDTLCSEKHDSVFWLQSDNEWRFGPISNKSAAQIPNHLHPYLPFSWLCYSTDLSFWFCICCTYMYAARQIQNRNDKYKRYIIAIWLHSPYCWRNRVQSSDWSMKLLHNSNSLSIVFGETRLYALTSVKKGSRCFGLIVNGKLWTLIANQTDQTVKIKFICSVEFTPNLLWSEVQNSCDNVEMIESYFSKRWDLQPQTSLLDV